MIYGLPNDNALPGWEKKCSFFRKRDLNIFLWVLPFKPAHLLSRKADHSKASFIQRALDNTVALFLRTPRVVLPNRVERAELFFDSAYDDLNDILKHRFTFMLNRGATDLNFRLRDNPDKRSYDLIVKKSPNHGVEAVLIYKECFQDEMKVLFVADLFGLSPWSMIQVWYEALILGLEKISIWSLSGHPDTGHRFFQCCSCHLCL